MPKRKKKKGNINSQGTPQTNQVEKKSITKEQQKDLVAKVNAEASEQDIETAKKELISDSITDSDELFKQASDTYKLLNIQRKHVENKEIEITKKEKAIEKRTEDLNFKEKGLDVLNKEISEKNNHLQEDEKDYLARLEEIVKRELDADAGFIKRNREALEKLEKESKEIQDQFSEQRQNIFDDRLTLEKELQEKRDQIKKESEQVWKSINEEIAAYREESLKELEAVEEEKKTIKDEAKKIKIEKELFEENSQDLDDRVMRFAAREIEQKNSEIKALNDRIDVARLQRDQYAQKISDLDELNNRFGELAPEEVLTRLKNLEIERDKLKKELGSRPQVESMQRLDDLVRQKELWETDKFQLMAELGELRQEASRKRIAVTELESLRDEKRALESANALLTEAITQLRAEVDTLVKGAEGKSPFPSCSEMDTDNKLQNERPKKDEIKDLEGFAEYVRDRMAFDPNTGKVLYYSKEDVRSFLGGLAMSRLHLLQGISGTGKTSLPLAFTRAIGAGSEIIEVQAGWRDRQDLIGHFNTFERRFYESKFLQALYRASTPLYRDTPFIIVMDEMNLSHPEQYFADILSALERDKNLQSIVLMTASVDPSPRLLSENGKELKIPENVWFVGTANLDETTKDFADKTYDRAHVMELPRHAESFAPRPLESQGSISLKALHNSFDSAMKKHQREATKAYEFLHETVGDILGQRFQVGWGNRLERQMGFYVPVVISTGGNVGEAIDHILSTKLLRKIRDRYDNRPEDIMSLRDRIKNEWVQLDRNSQPNKSMSLLKQELHRLGHDDE